MRPTPSRRPPPRRAPPSRTAAPRLLRATVEYDGGRYRGWQAQVNARTVQGALTEAAIGVFGEGVRLAGAGRTDAGVHALGQVVSISLPPSFKHEALEKLRAAWNDALPPDIHVLSLHPAPPGFHARHSALLRVYRYRIALRRTAFGKPWVYWVKDALDVEAMSRAASLFVGRHDFFSFAENPEGHDSTLVEVSYAKVERTPGGDLLLFRIAASHFLWKMVRRLVGVLVEVGAGRLAESDVARLLASRAPVPGAFTAPASGLFLEAVVYPGDPEPPEVDPYRPGF